MDGILKKAENYVKAHKYQEAIDLINDNVQYDVDVVSYKLTEKYGEAQKKYERNKKKNELKQAVKKFKNLKKYLNIAYDKVDREYEIVFKNQSPKYINVNSSLNIEPRLYVSKKLKTVTLSIVVGFEQDDWIFTENVKIVSGGKTFKFEIDHDIRGTQVMDGGNVAEWMNIASDDLFKAERCVNTIIKKKRGIIRFSGEGYRDHKITKYEVKSLKIMMQVYKLLDNYSALEKYL